MIDRTLTAILAFTLLGFATAMITSVMFVTPKAAPRHVQLERVVITAKRAANTMAQTQPVLPATRSLQ